jgi:ABC-type Fe3+-citrate transport system substrate-binding protein
LEDEHHDKIKDHQEKNKEPRFQYDARWAIMTAKTEGQIVHVRRNEWERRSHAIDIEL